MMQIATDHSGNIYMGGSFASVTMNLGSYTLTNGNGATVGGMVVIDR